MHLGIPDRDLSIEAEWLPYLCACVRSRAEQLHLPRSERIHVLACVEVTIPTMNGVDVALMSQTVRFWWLQQCSVHLLQRALLRRAEHLRQNHKVMWLKHVREWKRLERKA